MYYQLTLELLGGLGAADRGLECIRGGGCGVRVDCVGADVGLSTSFMSLPLLLCRVLPLTTATPFPFPFDIGGRIPSNSLTST